MVISLNYICDKIKAQVFGSKPLPLRFAKIREFGPAPQHRTSRRCPFGQNAGSRKREMSLPLSNIEVRTEGSEAGNATDGDIIELHI